eukprot:scaffold200327_cov13-Tisochrysis_lutea.AAC.1
MQKATLQATLLCLATRSEPASPNQAPRKDQVGKILRKHASKCGITQPQAYCFRLGTCIGPKRNFTDLLRLKLGVNRWVSINLNAMKKSALFYTGAAAAARMKQTWQSAMHACIHAQ